MTKLTRPEIVPFHPGTLLDTEFLKPLKITRRELAKAIGVSSRTITDFVHGRRDLTPDLAMRLGRFFGVSAQYWLNLQITYQQDCLALAEEQQAKGGVFDFIKAFKSKIAML